MPAITQLSAASTTASSVEEFHEALVSLLQTIGNIDDDAAALTTEHLASSETGSIPNTLSTLTALLRPAHPAAADALVLVLEKTKDPPSHGGLGITISTSPSREDYEDVLFLISAHLTALTQTPPSFTSTISDSLSETQPMNLAQKIFALHSLSVLPSSGLHTGSVVRVGVDWILASELSWSSMERTHQDLGNPGIWRNDRFWLAGDHIVHPDVRHIDKVKSMVDVAEKAKKMFRMTEYQGMNYTIMHTEFVRERAEPGMLCIGSDSHTCSGGAVGCLSIGLGAADVMMALALGETWFKIPESIQNRIYRQAWEGRVRQRCDSAHSKRAEAEHCGQRKDR